MIVLDKLPEAVRDHTRPIHERVEALLAALTLDEKIGQLLHDAPAIERFGIPSYNWWNECSHGVGRAGLATVFPSPIAHAASFDVELVRRIGDVTADEARAKHHAALRDGIRRDYYGLTYWTPNINIVRDPRWGRTQETYGEDPYLTARIAIAYIKALQGDDPHYYKLTATAKHFAVHSGPEAKRHTFNATATDYDLWDTYLPAFEACVKEGRVESIMGAYNRTNGEPCSASPTLLIHILREKWGFEGHTVSDCGAIEDLFTNHRVVETEAQAAAMALHTGCDLICGCVENGLREAVANGTLTESQIDVALRRLFTARFRLGMFDPSEVVAYTQIPYSVVDCPPHAQLAVEAARAGIVLLKNDDTLPLDKSKLGALAVIGPNANSVEVLLGNYHGTPSQPVTILEGLRRAFEPHGQVIYAQGCELAADDESGFSQAIVAAQRADAVIFVGGLSQVLEGENFQDEGVPAGTRSQGDRTYLDLPPVQERLLKALHATGKPVILVILSGSAMTVNWADSALPAIMQAWYAGQGAGVAVADALFGDYNPAGRMPLTTYRTLDDVPDIENYDMTGRTYRYFTGEPLYAFGHGLSYTTFRYHDLQLSHSPVDGAVTVSVSVTNTGKRNGDEVTQVYISQPQATERRALRTLQHFTRTFIKAGETRTLSFTLTPQQFSRVDSYGNRVVDSGTYQVHVGGFQPGYAPRLDAIIAGEISLS